MFSFVPSEQVGSEKVPFWPKSAILLLCILSLAAFLRLFNLRQSPPGLNQDAAANAWNAYCLLKTGKDQVGVSWPIFYSRGLGCNQTTLYYYAILPFQAIGGLNVITTRLPNAIGGVLTVLLMYFVATALFNRHVGLVAALLLTVNPWHLQQSRWGHEAGIFPFVIMLPFALALFANLPLGIRKDATPRPAIAALAGIAAGIACYGYHSIRLYIPVFMLAAVVATFPAWVKSLKNRRALLSIALFLIGFAAFFGPLAFKHITDPEGISKRAHGEWTWTWDKGDPPATIIKKVLRRYPPHFGLDFLFIRGDERTSQAPPDAGQFHWYMLILMPLGLIAILPKLKYSPAARILFAFVITYPAGDLLIDASPTAHALRGMPGTCSLVLLAAVGAVSAAQWLWRKNIRLAICAGVIFVAGFLVINVRYLHCFYGEFNRRTDIYDAFQVDLIQACDWLKPRLNELDAVFFTSSGFNMPYIITLVALAYEPSDWFSDKHTFYADSHPEASTQWDLCTRYGKFYFMYDASWTQIAEDIYEKTPGRILFVVRPGEFGNMEPIHKIYQPDGTARLYIYLVTKEKNQHLIIKN